MFLIWNTGGYSTTVNRSVVLPAQNESVGVGGSLGGLTPSLCKAGRCLVQVLNLERWVLQAGTLSLQGSSRMPQSLIKRRKLLKHNT